MDPENLLTNKVLFSYSDCLTCSETYFAIQLEDYHKNSSLFFITNNKIMENVQYQLMKGQDSKYHIPVKKTASNLLYIKNLVPNAHYVMGMNDLEVSIFADAKGYIYWNDKKDALPLGLAWDVAWTLTPQFTEQKEVQLPVGVFKSSNMIWTLDNNKQLNFSINLAYYKPNTRILVKTKRILVFKNNSVVLLPETKSRENFTLNFSGIGIL
jgi:hypothetical protein